MSIEQLAETAQAMVAPGKGIIAIDESTTTIAKRLMINYCERQSLERAFMATLEQLPEPLVPSIEEQAIVLETLHELDVLLSELPPNIRSAFLMSQLEGVTYEEIAVRLQVSVRTVTRYMAQGFRQCLRLMLTSD